MTGHVCCVATERTSSVHEYSFEHTVCLQFITYPLRTLHSSFSRRSRHQKRRADHFWIEIALITPRDGDPNFTSLQLSPTTLKRIPLDVQLRVQWVSYPLEPGSLWLSFCKSESCIAEIISELGTHANRSTDNFILHVDIHLEPVLALATMQDCWQKLD